MSVIGQLHLPEINPFLPAPSIAHPFTIAAIIERSKGRCFSSSTATNQPNTCFIQTTNVFCGTTNWQFTVIET